MNESTAKWVNPHYLQILHHNYINLQDAELDDFVTSINYALSNIDEEIVLKLLASSNWRKRLTGSWFIGLKRWHGCTEKIGELLIENKMIYAGQGYCFALSCFADIRAINYLTHYLDRYLPKLDCYYDQNWAMASLMWIDNLHGSNHARKYLRQNGLWEKFVANKPQWSLELTNAQYKSSMVFCNRWFGNL